jgi:hypothetical protein
MARARRRRGALRAERVHGPGRVPAGGRLLAALRELLAPYPEPEAAADLPFQFQSAAESARRRTATAA